MCVCFRAEAFVVCRRRRRGDNEYNIEFKLSSLSVGQQPELREGEESFLVRRNVSFVHPSVFVSGERSREREAQEKVAHVQLSLWRERGERERERERERRKKEHGTRKIVIRVSGGRAVQRVMLPLSPLEASAAASSISVSRGVEACSWA